MLVRELVNMIHQNALAHGWWESERSPFEVIALIHSEWSEALEEARAGKPMVYYSSTDGKPEGIAVELIDGCIRILDAFGEYDVVLEDSNTGEPSELESLWGSNGVEDEEVPDDIGKLIAYLHAYTSCTILNVDHDALSMVNVLSIALSWVHRQGLDPLKLMLEKHEYNKSRPYKHGKNF